MSPIMPSDFWHYPIHLSRTVHLSHAISPPTVILIGNNMVMQEANEFSDTRKVTISILIQM
jgi:hypothetical protein